VLAGDRRFDLLLIDFAMPLMSGNQREAEVRQIWTAFVAGYVENGALRPVPARGRATPVGWAMRRV
jgi:CheY-like chemotaxis protein